MPIVNGSWVNYSLPCQNVNMTNITNTSNHGISCIINSAANVAPAGASSFWFIMLVVWYISLLFFTSNVEYKWKYVMITFSGLFLASIMSNYSLITSGYWDISFGVFVLSVIFERLLG